MAGSKQRKYGFLPSVWKKLSKAAPRFELGIKDLQSSALPLGHAATWEPEPPSADRISHAAHSLLVICNGHGEDLIAVRVLEALHSKFPNLPLAILPLVGEGKAFDPAVAAGWLKRLGPVAPLPSGGFSNQSLRGLIADLAAGLTLLSWRQWKCVRRAAKSGQSILAVGDLLPLLLAWSSGGNYGFIGTPKSDYTWRSGPGQAYSDHYHRLKGSEWDPWEWALMQSSRCRMIAVRDHLTARGLRRHGVSAQAPGNPMMDGFKLEAVPAALKRCRRLLLLCGSRMPEAGANFKRLLEALDYLDSQLPLAILVALGSQPTLSQLEAILKTDGYRPSIPPIDSLGAEACWVKGAHLVLLGPGQFSRWASWAEVGLATAGTATEQLVGIGVPALSMPGPGPQFKRGFALRQSRLLGGAVIPCQDKKALIKRLNRLLNDSTLRQQLGNRGRQRMGKSGGSAALAELVSKFLLGHSNKLNNALSPHSGY